MNKHVANINAAKEHYNVTERRETDVLKSRK